jgi:hypothetical protein
MPRWPLDQLDAITVRVGEPAGPELVRAIGGHRFLGVDSLGGEAASRVEQRLHLDDEVAETPRVDTATVCSMDELNGDELIT